MPRSLFISYDGPSHDYLESLFLPILSSIGFQLTILELCPATAAKELIARLRPAPSIQLQTVAYPHRSSSLVSAPDALLRAWLPAQRIFRQARPDVLHTRGYIPAVLGLALKFTHPSLPFVLDLDGSMPQERVDTGAWSSGGPLHRSFSHIERLAIRFSDVTICRTERAAMTLRLRVPSHLSTKLTVVPNGTDPQRFKPVSDLQRLSTRTRLGIPSRATLLIHSGSFGPTYAPDALFELFHLLASQSDAYYLVLATHDPIEANQAISRRAMWLRQRIRVRNFPHAEMPEIVAAADFGLALRAPLPSQSAVSPIKVCEYLCAGVPVVTNAAVGDLASLFAPHPQSGVVIDDLNNDGLMHAAHWILEGTHDILRQRRVAARNLGISKFSLAQATSGYEHAYTSALQRHTSPLRCKSRST